MVGLGQKGHYFEQLFYSLLFSIQDVWTCGHGGEEKKTKFAGKILTNQLRLELLTHAKVRPRNIFSHAIVDQTKGYRVIAGRVMTIL